MVLIYVLPAMTGLSSAVAAIAKAKWAYSAWQSKPIFTLVKKAFGKIGFFFRR